MNGKRKAPTREATRAEAAGMETVALTGTTISMSNSTTGGVDSQPGFIAGLLLYGPENGLTLKDLERITDWPGRTIRKAIESERRAGELIISDNRNGYYLTDDPGEAQRFARSMQHRAREIRRTARAIERAAGLL